MEGIKLDNLAIVLIPVSVFIMISVVTCTSLWLFYQARLDHHETIRRALELNQPLDPEVLRIFKRSHINPQLDFRDGLIAIAIGISLGAIAALNAATGGDQLSSRIAGSVGILSAGLGIGLIIASKLRLKADTASASSEPKL
jgi:hypothetical protein